MILEKEEKKQKNISLAEASKLCSYSQDYLSLRARQGKIKAIKIGRNWFTTKKWLEEYCLKVNNSDFAIKRTLLEVRKPKVTISVRHYLSDILSFSEKKIGSFLDKVILQYDHVAFAIRKKIEKTYESLNNGLFRDKRFFACLKGCSLAVILFFALNSQSLANLPVKLKDMGGDIAENSVDFYTSVKNGVINKSELAVITINDISGSLNKIPSSIMNLQNNIDDNCLLLARNLENIGKSLFNDAEHLEQNISKTIYTTEKSVGGLALRLSFNIDDVFEESFEKAVVKFNKLDRRNEEVKASLRNQISQIPSSLLRLPAKIIAVKQGSIDNLDETVAEIEGIVQNFSNFSKNSFIKTQSYISNLPLRLSENTVKFYNSLTDISDSLFKKSIGLASRSKVALFSIDDYLAKGLFNLSNIFTKVSQWGQYLSDEVNYQISGVRDSLESAYSTLGDFLVPDYYADYGVNFVKDTDTDTTSSTIFNTQNTVNTVVKTVETIREVEKVINNIDSTDIARIDRELLTISDDLKAVSSQIDSRISYSAPSYAPVYIPSSGIQVSGHALLSSLNVSGSAAVADALSVGGNASFGDPNDYTTVLDVYSTANFNEWATFSGGASMATTSISVLNITGSSTFAGLSNFATTTMTGDFTVQGNGESNPWLYVDNTNGRVGIGTSTPDNSFVIALPERGANSYLKLTSDTAASFNTYFGSSASNQYQWMTNLKYDGSNWETDDATRGGWRMAEIANTTDRNSSFSIDFCQ